MTLYRFEDFTFDTAENRIQGPSGAAELRNQVQQLFELLLTCAPDVVSHQAILDKVWADTHVKDSAVPQLVLELRQALQQIGCDRHAVATVPRQGYRWTLPFDDTQVTQTPPQTKGRSWRWLLLLPIAAVAMFFLMQTPEPVSSNTDPLFNVVLAPFHNDTGNPDLAWFELGFPDVIGQLLAEDPELNVVPIADVLRTVEELQLDLDTPAGVNTLQTALGIDLLVQTTIRQTGDEYALDFRFHRPKKQVIEWHVQVLRPWDFVSALAEGIRNRISYNLMLPKNMDLMGMDDFTTQAYANGVHAFNLKDFSAARPYFEVVVNREVNNHRAWLYLAQCALNSNEYDACREICNDLLANDPPADLRRDTDFVLAKLHFNLREYKPAKSLISQHLETLRVKEDPDGAIQWYWLMGSIHLGLGERVEAKTWFDRALATSRANDMQAAVAASLWYRASTNFLDQENLPYLEESLDIASALGNDLLRAKIMNNIAHLRHSQGKYREARQMYEEALAVRRALKDKRGIGLGLMYLGSAESRFDHEKARQHFAEAQELFIEIQDTWNTINTYIYYSHLENIVGDFDASITWLDRALELAREAEDEDAFYYILFNKVATELRRGDLDRARHYLTLIRAQAELPPHKQSGSLALEALMDYRMGQWDAALQKMTRAREIENNLWNQGFEVYYEILVQAQVEGRNIPLPIDRDPAKWLFD